MRPIAAADLLAAWERSAALPPAGRALNLLAAADPKTPVEELGRCSVGERDRRLLSLRTAIFGDRLVARVDCPACGKPLELDFASTEVTAEPGSSTEGEQCVKIRGHKVEFRLPEAGDLVAIAHLDATAARQSLLARCVREARRRGREIPVERLPAAVVAEIEATMARQDPQAEVRLDLCCPDCSHRWQPEFDVVSFLWSEIDAWACRLLADVHALASAYGWSEEHILAMPARRRQRYLELVRA